MNDLPLLSIIVPVYNVEKYLSKCIESILKQNYNKLEIILVNDGSTDSCLAICNKYAKLDSRIQIIQKKNGGLSDARNAGMKIAKGEYIGFVDSDDWIQPEMYENLIYYSMKYNSDISECGMNYIYESHIENDNLKKVVILKDKKIIESFLDRSINIKGNVCSKIYRRTVLNDIKFPVGKLHEDAYFTYKVLYRAKKYVKIPSNSYNYLQNREGSIMTGEKNKKNILHVLEAFEQRNNFFIDKDEVLFHKSRAYYFRTLLSYYILSNRNKKRDNDLINILEKKIKLNKKDILTNKYLRIKKMKFLAFFISPNLFIKYYPNISMRGN